MTSPVAQRELEALRLLAAEGGAQSARAVGMLMGLESRVDRVEALAAPDRLALAALAGALGPSLVAVAMDLAAPLRGRLVLLVGAPDAERIASALAPSAAAGSLDAVGESAVVEAANIAGSAFVSALAKHLHGRLVHGVPRLTRGSAAECLDDLAPTLSGPAFAPRFRCGGLEAMLLFLPDGERVPLILAAMEAR
ncbi:MAG TPA: hypothetical protein VMK42_13090 [Anaeromyxobacteraceae bacterium]|nr:hypothetical protein [Anaeromyxobacteraceae bacterium]